MVLFSTTTNSAQPSHAFRKSVLYGLLGGAAAFLAVQLCAVLSSGAYADGGFWAVHPDYVQSGLGHSQSESIRLCTAADLQEILSGSDADVGALLLASVLLAPLLEELIYRGILLTGLSHLLPATQAVSWPCL